MKKNFKYALMSAIAFAGSVSFSACSSSDEVIDNPNYDPETNSVKAQFAISLGDNVVKTRMSSENTQASGTVSDFRGIQEILLIPFKKESAASVANANLNGKVIALGAYSGQSTATGSEKNYLYNNVDVKTGTDYFYLYAVAQPGTKKGYEVGRLAPTLPAANATTVALEDIKFSPVPIKTSTEYSDKQTQADNVCKNLVAKLNQVWNAEGWSSSTNVSLLQARENLKALKVGSSEGVQRVLQDLYINANAFTDAEAEKIKTAITANLTSPNGSDVTVSVSGTTLTFGSGYNDYPISIGLPNGSARLTFDETNENPFNSVNTDIIWSNTNTTPLDKFVYPADLRYFVQTGIKTSTTEYLKENITSSTWSSITTNYTGSAVDANTRSIILTNPVQYGVGRLEANIAQMTADKYYDGDHNEVSIPAAGFQLTGIVIGGQKVVNSTFEPGTDATIYTIYDSEVNVYTSKTADSGINHTLVLETPATTEIQIALQFKNNSDYSFKGADGIIYPNQTFYLLAKLNPGASTGVQQPSSETINQVFKQDYVTKATFTINPGSSVSTEPVAGFGTALNGLPDLTTSELEFGLSVNLEWKPGLTFSVNI